VSNPGDHKLVIDASGTGESNAKRQLGISPAPSALATSRWDRAPAFRPRLPLPTAPSPSRPTVDQLRVRHSRSDPPGYNSSRKKHSRPIQFTPSSSGTDPAKVGFISNAEGSPTVAQVTGTASHRVPAASPFPGMETDRQWATTCSAATPSGPFEAINTALDASTSYTDSTVVAGTTYYYATTAVNAQGDQSPTRISRKCDSKLSSRCGLESRGISIQMIQCHHSNPHPRIDGCGTLAGRAAALVYNLH